MWLDKLIAIITRSHTEQPADLYDEVQATRSTRRQAERVLDDLDRKTSQALAKPHPGLLDPLNDARRTVGQPVPGERGA